MLSMQSNLRARSENNGPATLIAGGYGILCLNYCGSSSHGEKFSTAATGRMGRDDYSDCISVVKAAIEAGFIYPEKVVVAGRLVNLVPGEPSSDAFLAIRASKVAKRLSISILH